MKKVSKTDWVRLAAMGDEDIDTSDILELGDAFFKYATIRQPADADTLEDSDANTET